MALNIDKILEARIQKQNRFIGTLLNIVTPDYLLQQSDERLPLLLNVLERSTNTLLDLIDCYRNPGLLILGDESIEDVEVNEAPASEADTEPYAVEEELTA